VFVLYATKFGESGVIEAVREKGFEGIVAKRRDSVYKPGLLGRVAENARAYSGAIS
jgi:hypothetical protein